LSRPSIRDALARHKVAGEEQEIGETGDTAGSKPNQNETSHPRAQLPILPKPPDREPGSDDMGERIERILCAVYARPLSILSRQ
jgi:hypothetical protein